ncbi:uncharacterized protein ATNIH1004_009217 [Aspergillus tanneri]|uniref:Uncharacterized protein n=1 Tax=Aspergillus tanneri TaxID=1220188 RepID=A0A5M9MGW0_9EURO|nr:uncharacterized protein ATNIH1004_009217 [Aspergillus tanneri]KAA8645006.1 hypothetical protein ATNIH1004_009217 [Aspergillus tanneri]
MARPRLCRSPRLLQQGEHVGQNTGDVLFNGVSGCLGASIRHSGFNQALPSYLNCLAFNGVDVSLAIAVGGKIRHLHPRGRDHVGWQFLLADEGYHLSQSPSRCWNDRSHQNQERKEKQESFSHSGPLIGVAVPSGQVLVVTTRHSVFDYWYHRFLYQNVAHIYLGMTLSPRPQLRKFFLHLRLESCEIQAAEDYQDHTRNLREGLNTLVHYIFPKYILPVENFLRYRPARLIEYIGCSWLSITYESFSAPGLPDE